MKTPKENLRDLILKEIEAEMSLEKRDRGYIQRLQVLADKPDRITFDEFIATGRFECKACFVTTHPQAKLNPNCTDIVRYAGGYFIQGMKNGTFLCGTDESLSFGNLESAEAVLWTKVEN